jgi:hypothetical protein
MGEAGLRLEPLSNGSPPEAGARNRRTNSPEFHLITQQLFPTSCDVWVEKSAFPVMLSSLSPVRHRNMAINAGLGICLKRNFDRSNLL